MPPLSQFFPAPRRVGRKRDRSSAAPAPPGQIHLIEVFDLDWSGEALILSAALDTSTEFPLASPLELDPEKWTGRYAGVRLIGVAASRNSIDSLSIEMIAGVAQAGPDELNYAADPSDVMDTRGYKLAAFSGFPLWRSRHANASCCTLSRDHPHGDDGGPAIHRYAAKRAHEDGRVDADEAVGGKDCGGTYSRSMAVSAMFFGERRHGRDGHAT